MSSLYLVRHGQAGTRDSYDSLSDLGRRQARLLGEYFLSQEIEFSAAYSGTMLRQRQTAAGVGAAYMIAFTPFPEIVTDEQWNEFDLAQVYREIGPLLSEADSEFRTDYEEMLREVRQSAGNHESQVHRRWRPCDTKIVETWVAERFRYGGEKWKQFYERVAACSLKLSAAAQQANILVFTSATPTAILTDLALKIADELSGERVRKLAGVLYNSSYTLLSQRGEHLQLLQFNAVPHLTAPELRTHR